jgi:phospholipid/cholesterol/gamma-HCH transport system substrate-binding protein
MLTGRMRLQSWLALILVAVTVGGLGLVIKRHYGDRVSGHSLYMAEFDGVSGLMVGTPVKINGVVVGSVRSMALKPQKNFTVDVAFALNKEIPLPDDSRAAIVSESLFGSPVLVIYPGMSETKLETGALIVDTQPPVQMHELLQKLFFNAPDSSQEPGNPSDKDDEGDKETPSLDQTKNTPPTKHSALTSPAYVGSLSSAMECGGWV